MRASVSYRRLRYVAVDPDENPRTLHTYKEAGDYLRVCEQQVGKLVKAGKLQASMVALGGLKGKRVCTGELLALAGLLPHDWDQEPPAGLRLVQGGKG